MPVDSDCIRNVGAATAAVPDGNTGADRKLEEVREHLRNMRRQAHAFVTEVDRILAITNVIQRG